ncbi:hypothetical protein E2C01_068883 [Portunus trituberculatus]|uniref:Uncharacterized protein n=1 Tax=Portunus trituberculatus TaxID=210409 RepID=A0A5B7HX46_PORTR|nr:hypothetical protein [Portunus trituberculatus]
MNLSLAKFTCGGIVAMDYLVHAGRLEFRLGGPTVNLAAPWHFVCATLCSASVATNSGDLLPIWSLPAQQVVPMGVRTMVLVARTKVGGGNRWKNGSYSLYITSY